MARKRAIIPREGDKTDEDVDEDPVKAEAKAASATAADVPVGPQPLPPFKIPAHLKESESTGITMMEKGVPMKIGVLLFNVVSTCLP